MRQLPHDPVAFSSNDFILFAMKLIHDEARCDGCGVCVKVCPQQIIALTGKRARVTEPQRCMGCFGCEDECHTGAFRLLRSPTAGEDPEVESPPALAPEYDVVVVGAGPAGLGAAVACARSGHSVLVCERLPNRKLSHHTDGGVLMSMPGLTTIDSAGSTVRFPGLNIDLGDTGGISRLDRLGLCGPGGLKTKDQFPNGVSPGILSDKDRFVEALVHRAEEAGAAIWFNAKVTDLVREDHRICGVRIGDTETVKAKIVIAADGIHRKLSRKAKLDFPKGERVFATVLAYEYGPQPEIPRGLYYMNGDMPDALGMPPAMAGAVVSNRMHVLLVALFKNKYYSAPKPMDYYLNSVLSSDRRIRELFDGRLDAVTPSMLNGCRVVMQPTNRDIVRDGFISAGDAFVGGGELGNVPSLSHGVHVGEIASRALELGDVTAKALASAADFISDKLVKMTELNGRLKAMPLKVSEAELVQFFDVMQHVNYPTMLFGSPSQQAWMFTKLFARCAFKFVRHPRLLKLMTGEV